LSAGNETILRGGKAVSAAVLSGGEQSVASTGKAISTTVASGGAQGVFSAGVAIGTVLFGDQDVNLSGVASNNTISSSAACRTCSKAEGPSAPRS
jgi:autotransporter passenger strand-loop-strand repeat protein